MIAVDENEARAHPEQRIARRFGGLRKSGRKTGKLDRSTQECGSERI